MESGRTGNLEKLSFRSAPIRRQRDFIALFNALWFRDFPFIPGHEDISKRSMWTAHIGSVVKQCADLMGLFTCFETRGRTDAVIQKPHSRAIWAKIEWEWIQPFRPKVNEFEKLAAAADQAEVMIYVGYTEEDRHSESLERISKEWRSIDVPLVVFLITYQSRKRAFRRLQTYRFSRNRTKLLREQPALPWHVPDTKWSAMLADRK